MKKALAALTISPLVVTGLCAQTAASKASGQANSSSQASAQVPPADRKFAIAVAETDQAEIKVGNMAAEKSSNPQVKTVAQKLVEDHTKTTEAMKQIAQAKGLTLPTDTDQKHKMIAARLEKESGSAFDHDFLSSNSKDHHKVVAEFQKEADSGQDPEIKAFAQRFLPAVQEHTKMIDDAMSGSGSKMGKMTGSSR